MPVSMRSQRADSIGTSVSDTTAEIRIVSASVTANSRNRRPMTSPMNSSGIKTATSETRSEEHTSELQSLMRITYALFCLKKNKLQEPNNCTRRDTISTHTTATILTT